jgi:hypothetical protein
MESNDINEKFMAEASLEECKTVRISSLGKKRNFS